MGPERYRLFAPTTANRTNPSAFTERKIALRLRSLEGKKTTAENDLEDPSFH